MCKLVGLRIESQAPIHPPLPAPLSETQPSWTSLNMDASAAFGFARLLGRMCERKENVLAFFFFLFLLPDWSSSPGLAPTSPLHP